jgi:hypothetical protein
MNLFSRLAVALSLASTASLAQGPPRDAPFIPLEANCPIEIHATLEKSGNMLGAQWLQVTFRDRPPLGIVTSRITVRGFAPAGKSPEPSEISEGLDLNPIVDHLVDHPRPPNVSTVNVSHASSENVMPWLPPPGEPVIVRVRHPGRTPIMTDARGYAWVMGFTAVNSVELDSVNFADGTSWHATDGKPCRVPVSSSPW